MRTNIWRPGIVLFPGKSLLVGSLLLGFFFAPLARAAGQDGATLFNNNCMGCHTDGKNNIDPKKPIIGSKKLATKESLKAFLSTGAGNMPSFPLIAKDDKSVQSLYAYLKTLK